MTTEVLIALKGTLMTGTNLEVSRRKTKMRIKGRQAKNPPCKGTWAGWMSM